MVAGAPPGEGPTPLLIALLGLIVEVERSGRLYAAISTGSVHCAANTAGARIPSDECGRRWL